MNITDEMLAKAAQEIHDDESHMEYYKLKFQYDAERNDYNVVGYLAYYYTVGEPYVDEADGLTKNKVTLEQQIIDVKYRVPYEEYIIKRKGYIPTKIEFDEWLSKQVV